MGKNKGGFNESPLRVAMPYRSYLTMSLRIEQLPEVATRMK